MIAFIRSAMVREIVRTAAGSPTMMDWNSETGMSSTSHRDSAMRSAAIGSPVMRAISPKVLARIQRPDRLTDAAVARQRAGHRTGQHDPEVGGFRALVRDGLVRLERDDARTVDEFVEARVVETAEEGHLRAEKRDDFRLCHDFTSLDSWGGNIWS